MIIPDPTAEQCATNEQIPLEGGRVATAAWYPQMGGYTSHCLIVPDGDCLEVFVWHDGDFPFSGSDEPWPGEAARSPSRLHHCDADQFIRFGQIAGRVQDGEPVRPEDRRVDRS